MRTYPKKIKLIKLETLDDAEYPQEEKYPSGEEVASGLMWSFSQPVVGEVFNVLRGKLEPTFHTSKVEGIEEITKEFIIIRTLNSRYLILLV